MIDKALSHLIKKIDDKVLQLQEALGAGSAQDFAEYKKMVGQVQGLLTVRRDILDLQQHLEESDDE